MRLDLVEAAWGRAVDPDAAPPSADPAASGHLRAASGADGTFALSFPPGSFHLARLVARAAGHPRMEWEWGREETAEAAMIEVGDVVCPRAGTIAGRLTAEDGRPVRLANLRLRTWPAGEIELRFAAAAATSVSIAGDGEFRVAGLPPGAVELEVTGDVGYRQRGPVVAVPAGETVTIDLRSDATNTVLGLDVELSYRREGGEKILSWYREGPDEPPRFVLVDSSGAEHTPADQNSDRVRFRNLPLEDYTLRLDDAGHGPWRREQVRPGTRLEAVLVGSAAVRLSVVDGATGEPVERFTAVCEHWPVDAGSRGKDREPLIFRSPLEHFSPPECVVRTRDLPPADGLFRGFFPGRYVLAASAPGYPVKYLPPFELGPGETRELVVRLGTGPAIAGTIRDLTGAPVAAATVRLVHHLADDSTWDGPDATAGETGEYRFDGIPPGTYHVAAVGLDCEVEGEPFSLGEEEVREDVDLVLPTGFGSLAGRIASLSPPSLPDLLVRALAGDARPTAASAPLAADGSFHLGPVRAGEALLVLEVPPSILVPFVPGEAHRLLHGARRNLGRFLVRPGEETVVEIDDGLHRPGFLAIRIHSAGTALPGREIHVLGTGASAREGGSGRVDTAGELSFGPLFPGEWRVLARDEEEDWDFLHPAVLALGPGEEIRAEVNVERWPGTLTCLAATSDRPWRDAELELAPVLPPPLAAGALGWNRVRTDANGVLTLALSPGAYHLRRRGEESAAGDRGRFRRGVARSPGHERAGDGIWHEPSRFTARIPLPLGMMAARILMLRISCFALVVASLLGCTAPHAAKAVGTDSEPLWAAPPLERAVSVRDGRTGEVLGLEGLLDRLARADVVFLGETHTDETTHRVELAAYEGLLARRAGRVVLAMEMFERDVQPALDAYLAGSIDEPTFLSRSRPWSNYRTAYRPLIEHAKAGRAPVVASNFPAPLRQRIAGTGADGLAQLALEDRPQAPAELLPNTPAYWRRVDNAIRGHLGVMGPRPAPDDPRLGDTQSLWDNCMGESCALALNEHPDWLVLHVNGGFHSEYWDGTVRQLMLRKPDARVATVAIYPSSHPAVEELTGVPRADYVVFAESRATDVDDGAYAVGIPRELRYRLVVPAQTEAQTRVPLLIWLGDDGAAAREDLAEWKERLGDGCAIAAIEAPYREIQEDLVEGARWFWPDSFAADVSALLEGVERVWAYLLRHHAIDPDRVCLAGEGTGATVAAAVALLTDRLGVRAIALTPRRFAKIKDFPLPLPELAGDRPRPNKSLRIRVAAGDAPWWSGEIDEYRRIGFASELETAGDDPWRSDLDRENAVRAGLGLEPRAVPPDAARRYVLADGPRARAWARWMALRRLQEDGELVAVLAAPPPDPAASELSTAVHAGDFRAGRSLPRCPGPFGGTTVIALPADLPPAEVEEWLALEKDDPLAKQGRFHRVRIATAAGERALPGVLAGLLAQGRKNALIVPAVFCADAATMRELQQSARECEDRMTLVWQPGLGNLGTD
ncbi:MAG: ChaN family lipoprotein [Planctomycetota bacterium]